MPDPITIGVGLGGAIGGALFGKRKRSACELISAGDQVPGWVINERAKDIAQVWGTTHAEVERMLGRKTLADIHLASFIPTCRSIEGDELTPDGHRSGRGLQIKEQARAQFRELVRSGRVPAAAPPRGGTGGDLPLLAPMRPGDLPEPPRMAGFSTVGVVAGLAVLLLLGRGS